MDFAKIPAVRTPNSGPHALGASADLTVDVTTRYVQRPTKRGAAGKNRTGASADAGASPWLPHPATADRGQGRSRQRRGRKASLTPLRRRGTGQFTIWGLSTAPPMGGPDAAKQAGQKPGPPQTGATRGGRDARGAGDAEAGAEQPGRREPPAPPRRTRRGTTTPAGTTDAARHGPQGPRRAARGAAAAGSHSDRPGPARGKPGAATRTATLPPGDSKTRRHGGPQGPTGRRNQSGWTSHAARAPIRGGTPPGGAGNSRPSKGGPAPRPRARRKARPGREKGPDAPGTGEARSGPGAGRPLSRRALYGSGEASAQRTKANP